MSQDWEEKRIKELFLELKRTEERSAPDFHKLWTAAASRAGEKRWHWLRVTAVAAALVLFGIIAALIFSRPTATSPSPNLATAQGSSTTLELPWQSVVLISEWRAPTDFLLGSSVEQFLHRELRILVPADVPRKN